MKNVPVSVCPLPHFEGLSLPAYETTGSAGMDVRAAVPETEGYEIQVRPRSGLAAKHGLTCLNTPGTIDSDYRGEIKVILINLGDAPFTIARGERVAQLVLAPVTQLGWKEVDSLDETSRGDGGFGSTGR